MNFRRKLVYTVIGCLLILAGLFTPLGIVDLNSQDASAQSDRISRVAIKTQVSSKDNVLQTEELTKSIKIAVENGLQDTRKLKVVPYHERDYDFFNDINNIDWKIYILIIEDGKALSISITLTHRDTFVMNHLKIMHYPPDLSVVESFKSFLPDLNDSLTLLVNDVLLQKMQDKNIHLIGDKSTIVVN